MARRNLSLLLFLLLNFAFAGLLFGQRAGRGIITGIVSDPTGAAVPGATVTVTDEVTTFKTVVQTSSDGNYGTPLLPLGTFTVQVEKQGFKTYVRKGVVITSGASYRQDATLELGTVTQTVEVTASSSMINVQTSDVSHALNQRYYQDLPVVMGTDIRLAESMLLVQPGYVPTISGDPMFRGSGFNSRLNGGQTMSVESFIDGAAFGYVNGHNETHESTPPIEAIAEMRVSSGSFSAQYGHTSGGFIEYTTKSGTNAFHGSAYWYVGNRSLNARSFFTPTRVPFQNNAYGVTAGGPVVIPHIYNGKNRTYIFGNLDITALRTGVMSDYNNTVPTLKQRLYDFSELLTYKNSLNPTGTKNTQLSTCTVGGVANKPCFDAAGRPIYVGEIFNPATTRLVGGIPVRDGYGYDATGAPIPGQENIIPAGDPLRSAIAAKVNALFVNPQNALLGNNHLGTAYGDPNGKLDPKTFLLRVDHQVSTNFKMYTTWYQNSRPALRNCNGPQGCTTQYDAIASPEKNTNYLYQGSFQRISVRVLHQQFDWVLKPNLFNHTTIGYDRWYMGGAGLNENVGWVDYLGLKDSAASYLPHAYGANPKSGSFPIMSFSNTLSPGLFGLGGAWGPGFESTNRWQFLDDLTWIKGKHTIKAGYEYRHHQTPQHGWGRGAITGNYNFTANHTAGYDAAGNNLGGKTGDPLASFFLGQVNSGTFTIFQPGTWYEAYTAMFVNDEIKVNSKLTLNVGLRWDYQFARTEAHDRYSSFDPTALNPVGTAANPVRGALTFAGTGTGRTGTTTFENPPKDAWGPRIGFAYRLTDKDVIRGGYGMYYAGISFNYSAQGGYPDWGLSATYPLATDTTGGVYPAYYWDVPSGGCPTAETGMGVNCGFPTGNIVSPPLIDPAMANNKNPRAVRSDGLNLPRYQNWSLTYQRQFTDNMSWEISYLGDRGTRLPFRGTTLGMAENMGNPSNLSLGAANLGAQIQSATGQAVPAVAAMPTFTVGGVNLHLPYATFNPKFSVAQALRPFPQYNEIYWRGGWPGGYSIYHSLQTKLERRFSNGLQLRVAYTWSKLINNGAENGLLWTGPLQNPVNLAAERGLSWDDVPHTLAIAYTYAFPFGKGKHWVNTGGVANQVIGGWHVSAIQRYESGRPIDITMTNDTGSYVYNTEKRPDKVGGGGWAGGKIDPATDRYLSKSGWADPGALKFGNGSRSDPNVRSFAVLNEDINLFKEFFIKGEDIKVRFETQFGNAFNRTQFCGPNSNWSSGDFGKVTGVCNSPRHIDFGLKLYW